MAIPDPVAAEILAKCARHCCICRRFKPLYLQVHHIIPVSEGGTDDRDNLIALCLTCHCDVHTKAPFTRRFTPDELKRARDAVFHLVAEGKLPGEVPGAVMEAVTAVERIAPVKMEQVSLSATQVEILVAAGTATGPQQGFVEIVLPSIEMGGTKITFRDNRESARFREAFEGLCRLGVFDRTDDHRMFCLNESGYRMVDQLLALGARAAGTPPA